MVEVLKIITELSLYDSNGVFYLMCIYNNISGYAEALLSIYEEKLKQYDTELKRIEDKLRNVEKVDKDFYVTAEYIIQFAKHSILLNVKWKRVRWGE